MNPTPTDFERWEQALRPKLFAMMALGHRPASLAVLVREDCEASVVLARDLLRELREKWPALAQRYESARSAARPSSVVGLVGLGDEALIFNVAEARNG
ncbi:MAG: hypothetical protein IPG50_21730 [Myxococcales bacterium]|nr:hypothetical protein [Myxococcales bacterium]